MRFSSDISFFVSDIIRMSALLDTVLCGGSGGIGKLILTGWR